MKIGLAAALSSPSATPEYLAEHGRLREDITVSVSERIVEPLTISGAVG